MSTASTSRPLPRPLHLVSNTTGMSGSSTSPSANDHGPLSAPLSRNRNGVNDFDAAKSKLNPRRLSSISYNTGLSKALSPGSELGRRNSLGSKVVLGGEATHGNENGAPKAPPLHEIRETEPVTLAEKHADLLRFIAQKESKCLELRTQLAQHEADLLLLKRKWERIVSKGLPLSARTEVQTTVGSDMLDGIREGVQSGLGKVFAVLEPSKAGPSPASQPQLQPSTPQLNPKRYSQQFRKDSFTSSGKRASVSTTSSGSTRDRSSLSESRSSSSSLFEELSSPESHCRASSGEGGYTACPSPNDGAFPARRGSRATSRNPSPNAELPADMDTEISTPRDDQLSKNRTPGPLSINLLHLPPPTPASMTSESLTPLSKQMANWVPPGLNKKWEEFKGSETLSKQSKRASILLNDMLAVLAPPVSSPSTTHRRNDKQPQSLSQHTLRSTFSDSTKSDAGSIRLSPPSSPSLLDGKNECGMGKVLQPQVKVPSVPKDMDQIKDEDKDEEEWNW